MITHLHSKDVLSILNKGKINSLKPSASRKITILVIFLLIAVSGSAQIVDDFENNRLNQWYSEGDGSASVDETFGNPGSSLEIDDNATGDINYAIAPGRYLGMWESSEEDTLSVDFYVQSNDPDTVRSDLPVFELSGPGGHASSFIGLDLPRNTWNKVSISLDSTQWTIHSGSWKALMNNVTLFRIRAEFIHGNESVFLDNITLTISPVRQVINEDICSGFENQTYDGWNFEENGSLSIDTVHGSTGYGIGIADQSGAISTAIAPPKFLGDWTPLLDGGKLKFDLKITTGSSTLIDKDYLIRISGKNSTAEITPADSSLEKAVNQWHTFVFNIDSNEWDVTTGSWDSLISNVEEIRIAVELINGNDVASFDNFCLIPGETFTQKRIARELFEPEIYPVPSKGIIHITSNGTSINKVELFDLTGKLLHFDVQRIRQGYRLSSEFKGIAVLRITETGRIHSQKVIFR